MPFRKKKHVWISSRSTLIAGSFIMSKAQCRARCATPCQVAKLKIPFSWPFAALAESPRYIAFIGSSSAGPCILERALSPRCIRLCPVPGIPAHRRSGFGGPTTYAPVFGIFAQGPECTVAYGYSLPKQSVIVPGFSIIHLT